jgi:hypothetical protein
MKRPLFLLALVAPLLAGPPALHAQCNQKCVALSDENGQIVGHGCVTDSTSSRACIATASRCTQNLCHNALVTSPDGAPVELLRLCPGKPARVALHDKQPRNGPGDRLASASSVSSLPGERRRRGT